MRRAVPALAAVALLGITGCGGNSKQTDAQPAAPGPAQTASSDDLRTESFGDVELAVPASWGHQTGDVAAALWCISDAATSAPVVIRPGLPIESTCPGPDGGGPDPATLMAKAGQFVSMVFAAGAPDVRTGTEGDRVTTKVGAVLVRVQAPNDVRTAILNSLHQITVDAHGCPVTDPISAAPARRPDHPVAVGSLQNVQSVAACRYAIPGGQFANPSDASGHTGGSGGSAAAAGSTGPDGGSGLDAQDALPPTIEPLLPADTAASAPTLLSSTEVTGDAAREAVTRIAASAPGAGPDSDGGCAGDLATTVRGTEEIVLRVTTSTGSSQLYLRYGGCHNGFDDGITERTLTRAAVAPFVSDANQVPLYGDELLRILDDPDAPATSGDAADDQAGMPSTAPGASG